MAENFEIPNMQWGVKRGIDLFVSVTLLFFIWPILAIIALAIMIESPGGAFYCQKRVGKNGRSFTLYKFRSMRKDCGDGNYLKYLGDLIDSERDGSCKKMPYRKMKDDCRVTSIGKIIRRFYIDELPQLINIIVGEMSLVGPRPHVQFEVDHYTPEQRRRLSVKPGVTGLWQIDGKLDCTFNELIGLDLYYIDHWNVWYDLELLVKTFVTMVGGGEKLWVHFPRHVSARRLIAVTGPKDLPDNVSSSEPQALPVTGE